MGKIRQKPGGRKAGRLNRDRISMGVENVARGVEAGVLTRIEKTLVKKFFDSRVLKF